MSVTYESASDLAQALRRAAEAHGEHEKKIGRADPDWPSWYAEYMVRQQRFPRLPERVDPKDMTTSQAVKPAGDADGDAERDFMLRYGAAGDDLST
jgi:hypothetical protein